MASYLINQIPNIQEKRYLELGIYNGNNFAATMAKEKVSVDIKFPASFVMSTNNFFKQLDPKEKFDIIYIDACHHYLNVYQDFNNSVKHLAEGGFIFVHDLIPSTKELTAPHYCGDGYKLLFCILKGVLTPSCKFRSVNSDYGLTVFINPSKLGSLPSKIENIRYEEFATLLDHYQTYSREEMIEYLRRQK